MEKLSNCYKQADWKTEKHAPVIECPDSVSPGNLFEVKLSIGKEIAHPNTTEHHIRWIRLYFLPSGAKAAFEAASIEFSCHGESAEGADQGPIHTAHQGSVFLKLNKSGTIFASSYCNIHGLWENSKEISVLA